MYSKVTCDRAPGLPGLELFLSTIILKRPATASPRPHAFSYSFLSLTLKYFFAHLGCFKLATLPNEKLISFPKTKLPLKAFSGQCAQSESKDNEYKAVMPSVAGREGTSNFTRTFFTYSFMHAFVGLCMHSSMRLFMRAFIHLTSSLLCVGYCLRCRSTKMKIFSVIEEFRVYQKRQMHSLAPLLLWWKARTGVAVQSTIPAALERCLDAGKALESEQMESR